MITLTRQKMIMVVDDSQGVLDVMTIMLELGGYQVTTTIDGRILHNLKEPLPDLILLDIMISGTDGRELCKVLKKNKKTKSIPVILISANIDIEKISKACGADGYLPKPFDMKNMLDLVEWHTAQKI